MWNIENLTKPLYQILESTLFFKEIIKNILEKAYIQRSENNIHYSLGVVDIRNQE